MGRAAARSARVVGALVGAGIPEERAKLYEKGIDEGGIVLGVTPRTDEDADYFEREWTNARGEQIYRDRVCGREAMMKRFTRAAAIALSLALTTAGASWAQDATRHSMEGKVTSLDAKKGWVHVKTEEGTVIVHVPPANLAGLKKGDTVTLDLAIKDHGPRPK